MEFELLGISWHRETVPSIYRDVRFDPGSCKMPSGKCCERSSTLQRCAGHLMDIGVSTEPNLGSHWLKTQVPPAVAGACLSLWEFATVHPHCGIF